MFSIKVYTLLVLANFDCYLFQEQITFLTNELSMAKAKLVLMVKEEYLEELTRLRRMSRIPGRANHRNEMFQRTVIEEMAKCVRMMRQAL